MLIYNNNLKAAPQIGGWLTFPIFFYIFSISIIYAQLTGSSRVEITNIKTEEQACEEAKEIALVELQSSILVQVQSELIDIIREKSEGGTIVSFEDTEKITKIKTKGWIKNYNSKKESIIDGNKKYCLYRVWKLKKELEKEISKQNRTFSKNSKSNLNKAKNSKSLEKKINYLFLAHIYNESQLSSYSGYDDISADIKNEMMDLSNKIRLERMNVNEIDVIEYGDKFNESLKFSIDSKLDLSGMELKVKLISGKLSEWGGDTQKIIKNNKDGIYIIPLGKPFIPGTVYLKISINTEKYEDLDKIMEFGVNKPSEKYKDIFQFESVELDVVEKLRVNYFFQNVPESKNIEELIQGSNKMMEGSRKIEIVTDNMLPSGPNPSRFTLDIFPNYKGEHTYMFKVTEKKTGLQFKSKTLYFDRFISNDYKFAVLTYGSEKEKYRKPIEIIPKLNEIIHSLLKKFTQGNITVNLSQFKQNVNTSLLKIDGEDLHPVEGMQGLLFKSGSHTFKNVVYGSYIVTLSGSNELTDVLRKDTSTVILSSKNESVPFTPTEVIKHVSFSKIPNNDIYLSLKNITNSKTNIIKVKFRSGKMMTDGNILTNFIRVTPGLYEMKYYKRGHPTEKTNKYFSPVGDKKNVSVSIPFSTPTFKQKSIGVIPYIKPFYYNETVFSKTFKTLLLTGSIALTAHFATESSKTFDKYHNYKDIYENLYDVNQQEFDIARKDMTDAWQKYSDSNTKFFGSVALTGISYGVSIAIPF